MATRSHIAVQLTNGDVKSVYCHWDGADHLPILQQNYNSQELAEQLISGGDMSVLGERFAPIGPHSYDTPEKGTTIFYGRDRGESGTAAETLKFNPSITEHYTKYIVNKLHDESYFYLFQDGQWKQFC